MQRGDNLSISTELVDARDNSHIWGQQYDRKLADAIAVRDEISKEMTTALRIRLTGEDEKRMAKSYTVNPEAYQDYLKGRYWWNKRTEDSLNKAAEFFQQAIAKDPAYALAYSGLADAYTLLPEYSDADPKQVLPKAKAAAQKALELDDSLAEAHASLGLLDEVDYDWPTAEREFQRAIALNPSYATAHQWYAMALTQTGKLGESGAELRSALALDPLSLIINENLAEVLCYERQYDQAIAQERKTLELDPSFPSARTFLGVVLVQMGSYQEGITEIEKVRASVPGDELSLTALGYAYARAGKRAEAQKILDQLVALSKQKYVTPWFLGFIYAGLGEKDKAFEWLAKSVDDRSAVNLKVDLTWDPLRSDPRYAGLLRRMNLQP